MRCPNSAVLPTPGSPRTTKRPAFARANSLDQSVEHVALAAPTSEPRRSLGAGT
jgi:hypothetical protein